MIHSMIKFLGGHSDVTGGVVVGAGANAIFPKVKPVQVTGVAVPSPFNCWLVLRGIRTLPYRMRAHSENGAKSAAFLSRHSGVEAVHYPGLDGRPGYQISERQMEMFGGRISVQVKGGREEAIAVAAKVELFTRATSLGCTQSFIEHRSSIEGSNSQTTGNLLRLSIGLENADDLIEDLA